MGCLQSKEKEPEPAPMKDPEPPKKVDPRLPWENYRQFFNMKNSWKIVTRGLESTAKETLMRFLKKHPEHKELHKNLKNMEDEEKMWESTAFENSAMNVFNTLDEVMESIDKVEMAIFTLENAGRAHAKIPGFQAAYFKDMEESFIEAVGLTIGDRFSEATEKNFRLFWGFCIDHVLAGYNAATGQKGATDANRL